MPTDHRGAIATLRSSQDHLAKLVVGLDDATLSSPSYCGDWSVAQVLSHLGSGAEIAKLGLDAARSGDAPPEREQYQAIWDRWNAKAPREMAEDALATNEAHVATLESMTDDELASLQLPSFGGRILDGGGAALMRLNEHAIHTWDVEVTTDDGATVQQRAVDRLVDLLPDRAGRLARGEHPEGDVVIRTTEPAREFVLHLGEETTLEHGSGDATSSLELPVEALIRLFSGRLDASHTPATTGEGPISLEVLRTAYPGF